MARSLKDAYWLHEENVSSVLFPRSYDPNVERRAFLDDFRLTAAAGLLKWFVNVMSAAEILVDLEKRRTIPLSTLEFATIRCQEFVDVATHEDLDTDDRGEHPSDEIWEAFLDDYTAAVHDGAVIDNSSKENQDQIQVRHSRDEAQTDDGGRRVAPVLLCVVGRNTPEQSWTARFTCDLIHRISFPRPVSYVQLSFD